jgi:hypothetical protein
VVEGDVDVDVKDLGENSEVKDDEYRSDPNNGYSIHSPSDARNHERPKHLRLFREGCEPRCFETDSKRPTTLRGGLSLWIRPCGPQQSGKALGVGAFCLATPVVLKTLLSLRISLCISCLPFRRIKF